MRGRMRTGRIVRMFLAGCLAAGTVVLASPEARAGNLEPAGLNLGLTSFFDGFGRNEEGFVYLGYAFYSTSDSINGNDGKPVPVFNNPKIDAYTLLTQFVYVFPQTLFGGQVHPGMDVILPLIAFNTSFDPPPPAPGLQLTDNGVGLGDLVLGPYLQWKPIFAGGRPVFSQRIEFDLIAPTGKYDPAKDINQGSNFVSINPYWAVTVLPIHRLEISARFHYLYNFRNDRPANPPPVMPAVVSAQAGQAFWVNYAASFEVVEKLHVGVNGYYFAQFTDDQYTYADGSKNNGQAVPELGDEGRAKFLTIGPGVFWDVGKQDKLFFNAYFTLLADNHPSSSLFNLHYIHSF
jgi:hypothetical protein